MGKLVEPTVYLVGYTSADSEEIKRYLKDSDQEGFLDEIAAAAFTGVEEGEILCSIAAKMCYKALTTDKNANITKVRPIRDNLLGCIDSGHLSVFEHCQLNFIVRDCSRIYTHEQVRHRPGWAYSQTSGRYCRLENIDLVWDPILEPVKSMVLTQLTATENTVYLLECELGLRKWPADYPGVPARAVIDKPREWMEVVYERLGIKRPHGVAVNWPDPKRDDVPAEPWEYLRWVPDQTYDFEKRKKLTSAIRRIAPNGQSNELFMSANLRALRHYVQLRTQRFAEREIRIVAAQVYRLTKAKFPVIFEGATEEVVDGIVEVSGLKQQPYEKAPAAKPDYLGLALVDYSSEDLLKEIGRRGDAGVATPTE